MANLHLHTKLECYDGGIRLGAFEDLESPKLIRAQEIMQLPSCFYFMNTDSICEQANETSAAACGWDSPVNFKGESIYKCFSRDVARKVTDGHQSAMKNRKLQIVEEDILLKDNASFQCLTFVWPWYESTEKIAGIFGCSIILNQHPLALIISQLVNYNLLTNYHKRSRNNFLKNTEIAGIYLSSMEQDCLQLAVRGRSAKEIGRALGISFRTVEHYLDNIKIKFSVTSRAELIDKTMCFIESI